MEFKHKIIDSHAHCGVQDTWPPQALGDYLDHIRGSGITGAVMFSPVMEIYDRYDYSFKDDPAWKLRRKESNEYLTMIGDKDFEVFPYLFIWNDFAVEQLTAQHRGIKWHRHSDEPRYNYEDPGCRAAIDEIRRRNMPVCLEEEWRNTLRFIDELAPGVRVIIPHCGFLNGGYELFVKHGIWERPNIYTDTSLVASSVVLDYVQRYGPERIMFGSDFPFGDPAGELRKVLRLNLTEEQKEAVVGLNVQRLLADSNRM
jgi:hypothetical protein